MRKIHTHGGHGHCDHCTHFCSPCNEIYCCRCSETWGKTHFEPYYVPYYPWKTSPSYPWYYTLTAGGTSKSGDNYTFMLNKKDMGKTYSGTTTVSTGFTSSGTHDHEHKN